MQYEWDEEKRQANLAKHGVDFEAAAGFIWGGAEVTRDLRREYRENRYIAVGFIGERLHVLIFTPRPEAVRVISLRKANKREVQNYENEA